MGLQLSKDQLLVLHRFGAEVSTSITTTPPNGDQSKRATCHIRDLATGKMYDGAFVGPSEQFAVNEAIKAIPTLPKPLTAAQQLTIGQAEQLEAANREIAKLRAKLAAASGASQPAPTEVPPPPAPVSETPQQRAAAEDKIDQVGESDTPEPAVTASVDPLAQLADAQQAPRINIRPRR